MVAKVGGSGITKVTLAAVAIVVKVAAMTLTDIPARNGRNVSGTCWLSVQPQRLLVPQVLGLLAAPLLPLGVLHLGAAQRQQLHRGHTRRLAHLHLHTARHGVAAAVEALARLREDDLEALHLLGHGNHDGEEKLLSRGGEVQNVANLVFCLSRF